LSIQKQLVPILIPDPLTVEERYTPTGKVIVGYGPFSSVDLLLLFHVLLQPKASRINIAPPIELASSEGFV